MHILITLAVIAAAAIIIPSAYIAITQSSQVYIPGHTITATPKDIGLKFNAVTLTTSDNIAIKAWFTPTDDSAAANTILFCHGNAGDIGDRVELIQTLHKLGFNSLCFDYRGFGESDGKPSETGTEMDAMAAWQYLTEKRNIPAGKIIIYGRSLGGAVASQLASVTTPKALVIESTFASIPAMALFRYPLLPMTFLCRFKYDNIQTIPKVNAPILVAHSRTDSVCPYEQGRAVYDAAGQPKQFVEIKGEHGDGGLITNPHYQTAFVKFCR
jgi:pimeloyl-ACP methyl ester carboxylesterase